MSLGGTQAGTGGADATSYEFIAECTDGCGAITGWVYSSDVADDAGRVHEREGGHHWVVRSRMSETGKLPMSH